MEEAFHHGVIDEFYIDLPGIQRRIGFEELPVFLATDKCEQITIDNNENKNESFLFKWLFKKRTAFHRKIQTAGLQTLSQMAKT